MRDTINRKEDQNDYFVPGGMIIIKALQIYGN